MSSTHDRTIYNQLLRRYKQLLARWERKEIAKRFLVKEVRDRKYPFKKYDEEDMIRLMKPLGRDEK